MYLAAVSDFITISTYNEYVTANLDKQRLEEAGIVCYLGDEHMITMESALTNVYGGIKLRVPKSQMHAAMEILEIASNVPYQVDANRQICPVCGSNNTKEVKTTGLLLRIGLAPAWRNVCSFCGSVWK